MTVKGIGYAFCVFKNKILQFLQKVKLIFQNSVFQIEFFVIEDAIHWNHIFTHTELLIFSDNISGQQEF